MVTFAKKKWVAFCLAFLLHSAWSGAEDRFLGHPVTSVTIPAGAQIKGTDGRAWVCAVANGEPAVMTVLDAITGERLHAFPLPGVHQSFAATTAGEDTIYIGSARNGHLYRWDPSLPRPVQLTEHRHFGQTHLNSVAVGSNGKIYAGSYPDALVIEYDPVSGELNNLGTAAKGSSYSRVAESEGVFYVATSAPGNLVRYDAEKGVRRLLCLPEGYDETARFSRAARVGNYIFFRINNDFNVYDPRSGEWVNRVENASGYSNILEPLPDDNKAYLVVDGRLASYNLSTHELETFALRVGAARSIGWVRMEEADYPGWTIVTLESRGQLRHYNPATGNSRSLQGDVKAMPISIRSMARGPDGNVYVGGYLSPREMARYNPDTETIDKLAGASQVEAMVASSDTLFIGRYPGASVFAYESAEAWEFGENPTQLFELSGYGQDRPFGFAVAGNTLAVGTVPVSGDLGGVLALYDLDREALTVFEDVVPDESIVSLAYRDGLLYGGTSVWGGIGADPRASEAKLFIWDLERGERIWMEGILPDQKAINGLEFDDNGKLWGVAGGTVFQFDPDERRIIQSRAIFPFEWSGTYWQSASLKYNYHEQVFYGYTAGKLFRLDSTNWDVTLLTEKRVGYFATDRYGDIYFSQNTELYKLKQERRQRDDR